MPRTDRYGLPVTASSDEPVARWEQAVDALLHFRDDVGDVSSTPSRTRRDSPAGPHRQLLRSMSTERPDELEAAEILEPLGDGKGLTEREQRLLAAVRAYAAGDLSGRASVSPATRSTTRATCSRWPSATRSTSSPATRSRPRSHRPHCRRGTSRIHSTASCSACLPFGLEECGLYDRAEATGLAALEHDPRCLGRTPSPTCTRCGLRSLTEAASRVAARDWAEGNFLNVHTAAPRACSSSRPVIPPARSGSTTRCCTTPARRASRSRCLMRPPFCGACTSTVSMSAAGGRTRRRFGLRRPTNRSTRSTTRTRRWR